MEVARRYLATVVGAILIIGSSICAEGAPVKDQVAAALVDQQAGEYLMSKYQFTPALAKLKSSLSVALAHRRFDISSRDQRSLSRIYQITANYDLALYYARQSLAVAKQFHNGSTEADDLQTIGITEYNIGLADVALNTEYQALTLHQKLGAIADAGMDSWILSSINDTLSRHAEAENCVANAVKFGNESGDADVVARAIGNEAHFKDHLGLFEDALTGYQTALDADRKVGDLFEIERNQCNIGVVDRKIRRFEQALQSLMLALAGARQIGDIKEQDVILANIGIVYQQQGRYDDSMKYIRQAIAIDIRIGDIRSEDEDLANMGEIYERQNNYAKARESFVRALLVEEQIGDLNWEADTFHKLMLIEQRMKLPRLAAYYGKRSVNAFQSIRANVASLGPKTQKAYVASIESTYHQLADLLIDQSRLTEAEQVIHLLKEQEYFRYLHPDTASPQNSAVDLLPYTPHEQFWTQRAAMLSVRLQALNREITPVRHTPFRSAGDQKYLAFLDSKMKRTVTAWIVMIHSEATDFRSPATNLDQIEVVAGDRDIPRLTQPGTALVYTIVGNASITEVVITPGATLARQSPPITPDELYARVNNFRRALTDPGVDPRPSGSVMYDLLIAPIRKDLDAAGVTCISFVLDDALRYIPMAALVEPSGKYLVQDYEIQTVTLLDRNFASASHRSLFALGLGTTQACEVGGDRFPALPGVATELSDVIRDISSLAGILPGTSLLDARFTKASMFQNIATRRYNVLHVASHFKIGATDTSSYLLLGDGTIEPVSDLRAVPNRFAGIDLLTLSACDTGEDIQVHDGHEIDSFGALMQSLGARSVIASLWPVSDSATPHLMDALYRRRAAHPDASAAKCLRQAQLTILCGNDISPATDASDRGPLNRRTMMDRDDSASNMPAFMTDAAYPYAHPFYWAAFTLIGDVSADAPLRQ